MSGIFRMSEPFGPGKKLFWVYWVAALPTTVIVMVFLILDGRVPALCNFSSRLWKILKAFQLRS